MNKNIITIALILIAIIIIIFTMINMKFKVKKSTLSENFGYEKYLDGKIYGTDVITLINKAMSNNDSCNVSKDEKGNYLDNGETSIIIDLVMITNEEEKETTTYRMEAISKVGISGFIKNFNTAKFECTKKEYHSKTGQISYIELTQK